MTKTYEEGIASGVRFAIDREEHYDRSGIQPLSLDHLFGDAVMIMKPRRELLKGSRNHLDQRIRAITSSALAHKD